MYNNYNGGYDYNQPYPQQNVHKTTKKDILQFILQSTQASEIVQVDDFESSVAKHICSGGNSIQQLQKFTYSLQTESGIVNIEYFFCNRCRKCIVDKNSIEPIY